MFLIGIVVFILAIAAGAASKRRRVSYGSHYESHRNWNNNDENYEKDARLQRRFFKSQIEREERRRDEQESRSNQKMWNDFFGVGGKRRRSNW